MPSENTCGLDNITSALCDQYAQDGVVFIKQALHPDWLMLLEMGLQRVMANALQQKHLFYAGEDREFIETVRNFDVTPEIQRLVYDSPIADMVGKLIGSENIWLYSDEFFVKDGGGCGRTPWHQDMPYYRMAGMQIASMWISLDPISKAECLETIPDTHRQTMFDGFNPMAVSEDPTMPYYDAELPPLPDIEAERDKWNIQSWDITPGDVIVLHPAVLHGGGPTLPGGRRRAITIRLYGDDITYAERPPTAPTVPLTPGLSQQLNPGDPLRSPWYPRIRPLPEHQRV